MEVGAELCRRQGGGCAAWREVRQCEEVGGNSEGDAELACHDVESLPEGTFEVNQNGGVASSNDDERSE
jgi:hypothetical protein